jgi:hypothetical protein
MREALNNEMLLMAYPLLFGEGIMRILRRFHPLP